MNQDEMAANTVQLLQRLYPGATCTLNHDQPWQLMAAAILAAQCTDARVNQVTPALFAQYPDVSDLAAAEQNEIERIIKSCGLYHNKARAILNASRCLVDLHQGNLPSSLEELTALPGIGRKIANLLLGDCFGIPAIVVDTHCARISRLIGLSDRHDPQGIENDLAGLIPESDWIAYGHLMVSHGRAVCLARRPKCLLCPLAFFCRHALTEGGLS